MPSVAWKAAKARPRARGTSALPFLPQQVAGRGIEVQPVDLLQLRDLAARLLGKGELPVEGVQADPLEKIAERHVLQLGQRLQDLHDPLLHAHARLDALDHETGSAAAGSGAFCYHGNRIPPRELAGLP